MLFKRHPFADVPSVRNVVIGLLLVLLAGAIYEYVINPAGCIRAARQAVTACGLGSYIKIGDATGSTQNSTWTPPSPLPEQPDWTWTTSTGKVYHQVKIIKVDPTNVTILDADGGSLIPISTLPPDLQKQLNYNPSSAAQ